MGVPEIRRDGVVLPLRGPRQRALLTALALRANEVVSVGYLADAVWDRLPASPHSNIRTYVREIRRLLRERAAEPDRLRTTHGGYQLLVRPGELDVHVFQRWAERGTLALSNGACVAALGFLGRAMALWRGQPLEGVRVGPQLRAEVVRLEERMVAVGEKLVRARIGAGDYGTAIGEVRHLLARHRFRESLWGHLMVALHRAGRRAEALATYHEVHRLLVDELGVEPGTELRELHQSMICPDVGRGDVKSLAAEARADRVALSGNRAHAHRRAEFGVHPRAGQPPDTRDVQLTRLKDEVTSLRQCVAESASTINDLTAFRTWALALLAAQHDEIVRLRAPATAATAPPGRHGARPRSVPAVDRGDVHISATSSGDRPPGRY
jgi:DNA-binding SARP family transcriptional activator